MTKLTWIESPMGPTEMWVEGRDARDYVEKQGFEIVEYEPPPAWLAGCFSGRAKIRKPGSECVHVWSPELAALHKFVCDSHSRLYAGGMSTLSPTGRALGRAHHRLFTEFRYHEELMGIERFGEGPLEVPQSRVVAAVRATAAGEHNKKAAKLLKSWADAIEAWRYTA